MSAERLGKTRNHDGSTTEPTIRSCDTDQWIPCLDSCQFATTCMRNIRLQAITLARKCGKSHWFACGADERACRRVDARSRDYQNFVDGWVTKFSLLPMRLHSRALCAKIKCRLQPSYNNRVTKTLRDEHLFIILTVFILFKFVRLSFLFLSYSGFSFFGSFSALVRVFWVTTCAISLCFHLTLNLS